MFALGVEGGESLVSNSNGLYVGDLAGDTDEKGVYSLEEMLARVSPTKIHANFLCAVQYVETMQRREQGTYFRLQV